MFQLCRKYFFLELALTFYDFIFAQSGCFLKGFKDFPRVLNLLYENCLGRKCQGGQGLGSTNW